jgi:Tfp pilus assembly protein PilO
MNRIQQWLVGAGVAVLLIAVGGYFFAIAPQSSHAKSIKAQAAQQNQTNQGLKGQIQVLQDQTQGVAASQARIAAISNELPPTANIASYVRALVVAAKTAGVDLMSIAPAATANVTVAPAAAPAAAAAATPVATAAAGAPSSRTTTTAPATPVTAAGTAATGTATALETTPLTIAVNGGYFQIQQFLAQLEKLPRATVVNAVTLTPGAPLLAPGATGAGKVPVWKTIQSTIQLNIFEAPALVATTPTTSTSPSTVQ